MSATESTDTRRTDSVSSPTLSTVLRRGRVWGLLLALVAVGTVLLTAATGARVPAPDLDVDSAAPVGARALAEVLREQGVDVVRADGLDSAIAALSPSSTLLINDPDSALDEKQYSQLAQAAAAVVLIAPAAALDGILPGVAFAGVSLNEGVLPAPCPCPRPSAPGVCPRAAGGIAC